MAHQTKVRPMTFDRLFVTDNIHTRHAIAKKMLTMIDGQVEVIGPVRMDIIMQKSDPIL